MEQKESVAKIPVGQTYANADQHPPQDGAREFSNGLCDCFSDYRLCCLTCWCPCITFGRIVEIVDDSSCTASGALYAIMSLTRCQWIYSCTYRSKIKARYGMTEGCCADCCVHFWCEPCALCQEYRQLTDRDLSSVSGDGLSLGGDEDMSIPEIPSGMSRIKSGIESMSNCCGRNNSDSMSCSCGDFCG